MDNEEKRIKTSAIEFIIQELNLLLSVFTVLKCLVILLVMGSVGAGSAVWPIFLPIGMSLLAILSKTYKIKMTIAEYKLGFRLDFHINGFFLILDGTDSRIFFKSVAPLKEGTLSLDKVLRQIERMASSPDLSKITRDTTTTYEYDLVLNTPEANFTVHLITSKDKGKMTLSAGAIANTIGISDSTSGEFKGSAETFKFLTLGHALTQSNRY